MPASSAWPEELADCEEQLDPALCGDELWFRTALARFVDDDELAPDAFATSTNDKGKLSGARSSKETPEGLYELRNRVRPNSVHSVWGLSVSEVDDHDLRLVDDSACPNEFPEQRSPGHTYLDLRGKLTPSERKTKRWLLSIAASDRGQLFPPA